MPRYRTALPFLSALGICGSVASAWGEMTLTSPVEYQVVQRTSRGDGSLHLHGRLDGASAASVVIEARLFAPDKPSEWQKLAASVDPDSFTASLQAPAGGWRRLEVRAMEGKTLVGEASVEHVGIGEVFVVAGQSNSANHGEERQRTTTGLVATFDGSNWRMAHDPQPGASGEGGSFLPPFGDALAEKLKVPIGIVSCGVGATSVREWLPRGSRFHHPPTLEGNVRPHPHGGWQSNGGIYDSFVGRLSSLGPRGFRAVLWHQGESDANQSDPARTLPGPVYREYLEKLIEESRRAIGWEAPWFVAQVSYHVPGDEASPDIRAAQASMWRDGLAMEGPDSDALKGEMREGGGQGVHFSGPGLRAHAARWVEKVLPWMDRASLPWPERHIGYSELRTNVPGGRHANARTTRAFVIKADGTGRREVAPALVTDHDTSSQFAGWSSDGLLAVVHQAWKSPETARWEEEHQRFRFTPEGCRLDACLVDMASGHIENVTAVDRVSFYNSGVFFWPQDHSKLGFTALIDGASHPFRMDRDGRNKTDLTQGTKAFSYGFSGSPDGRRIAFHQDYQIVIADADGSNPQPVVTGHPFNFGPTWSPDGQWLLFVSGEHYHCHPHIVRADGTGLRKLADRHGYRGVVEFLDVPDFHGGSSDTPVWAADGGSVFYTSQSGEEVALFRAGLDGATEQLTHAGAGTAVYHPQPSRDGDWLVYGAFRDGARQLIVMRLSDRSEKQTTLMSPGLAAMWPQWQPVDMTPVTTAPEEVPQRLPLWPGPAPVGEGAAESANAFLTVHRPAKPNGTAVVICPGGGYGGLVTDGEGSGIARWLNGHGITGIVLEYRLPSGRSMVPLLDAQRAIRTARARAAEWDLDPAKIGIIGFSAGGHLASTAATHFDDGEAAAADPIERAGCRPDFAILVYPVITMSDKAHGGSRANLLGPAPTPAMIERFSNETQVTARTSPTYLTHAVDDRVVSPDHSRMFLAALRKHNVLAEYLELPSGDHGLNGYKGPMWDAWQSGALRWLAAQQLIPTAP